MRKVIYPGTFDPITNGHLDIIKRASTIFDHVIVAVARSQEKKPMFDITTRVKMAHIATSDMPNVTIKEFDTLLVNFCKQEDAFIIIRGLRAVSDFEYELQMGYANRSLDKDIETLYLMPSLQNAFISSSVVRTILKYKGNVSHLVPQSIIPYLESR
ncbi:pantetheine-phosphate adenylyltransferase [Nitratiruptor sp. SB155-2]|uniref:pantetheine-phosphate adenylyltransferase n=1 Tax=Nitratiruptor sp. (strain SB155-2) TaxID=387092 RepID=UPI0001586FBA|nr:pantetheine-phosphate adenylyltransferase [Nitratiruptor sp. SB155-2]BAF69932.1 phosphopantetheine adenylyltransferase [Nitratiruptor sp. SB155-2]